MTHSRWFSFLFSTYERGGVRRYTINRELEQSLMESLLTGLVFHSSWPPEAATGRPLFLLSFLIESLASLTRLAPREPRSSNQPYPLFFILYWSVSDQECMVTIHTWCHLLWCWWLELNWSLNGIQWPGERTAPAWMDSKYLRKGQSFSSWWSDNLWNWTDRWMAFSDPVKGLRQREWTQSICE